MLSKNDTELNAENVTLYTKWVNSIARRLIRAKNLPVRYFDDLSSVGLVALVETSGQYCKSRNVPLKAFAYLRVRGAMIDYLRKYGEVTQALTSLEDGSVTEVIDSSRAQPDYQAEARRLWARVDRLSPTSRSIIHSLYLKDESMETASKRYNRTRSWVCRKHKAAIEELRETG